jgi:hypothetical protein
VRKTLQIASIVLILFTSTGISVGLHYCGKLLQDVALFGKTKSCCGGIEMPSGCCHDEKIEIKSDDCNTTQLILNLGFVPVLIAEIAYPVPNFSFHFQNPQASFSARMDKDRPPSGSDIVIRVQSLLI